jgi:HEPN domain-containing protein
VPSRSWENSKGALLWKAAGNTAQSHNLIYLLNKIGIKPPREPGKFIVKLNEASIPTRYPESLANLQRVYSRVVVKDILSKGKELVTWIKQQL